MTTQQQQQQRRRRDGAAAAAVFPILPAVGTITVAQQAATAAPEQNPPGTFQYGGQQQQIRAIEAALAAGGSVTAIVAALFPLLYGTGITLQALTAAVRLARATPIPRTGTGAAAMVTARQLTYYQAAQILNTAARLSQEIDQGMPARLALQREQRFLVQHREAQQRRLAAADAIDKVCGGDGTILLVWDAQLDKQTTPECAAADGGTFTAGNPPSIGYPGTVHMHCRCRAQLARWVGPSVDQLVGAATAIKH